jgi:hypothetical protein
MRMPGATVHAHSTAVAAASVNAVIAPRPQAVARAPFDILHNMKIYSAAFRGLRVRRIDGCRRITTG